MTSPINVNSNGLSLKSISESMDGLEQITQNLTTQGWNQQLGFKGRMWQVLKSPYIAGRRLLLRLSGKAYNNASIINKMNKIIEDLTDLSTSELDRDQLKDFDSIFARVTSLSDREKWRKKGVSDGYLSNNLNNLCEGVRRIGITLDVLKDLGGEDTNKLRNDLPKLSKEAPQVCQKILENAFNSALTLEGANKIRILQQGEANFDDAILEAVANDNTDVIKALISANVSFTDAILLAVERGTVEAIKSFEKAGLSLDDTIMTAVKVNNIAAISTLKQAGVDVNGVILRETVPNKTIAIAKRKVGLNARLEDFIVSYIENITETQARDRVPLLYILNALGIIDNPPSSKETEIVLKAYIKGAVSKVIYDPSSKEEIPYAFDRKTYTEIIEVPRESMAYKGWCKLIKEELERDFVSRFQIETIDNTLYFRLQQLKERPVKRTHETGLRIAKALLLKLPSLSAGIDSQERNSDEWIIRKAKEAYKENPQMVMQVISAMAKESCASRVDTEGKKQKKPEDFEKKLIVRLKKLGVIPKG
ncbi:hypothetical protein SCG7086_BA_00110 [Chlamydiales bacterium SCGC AG-110-P3]|nr:hypothetical protein SCG7086_BA_00110 [Chlamydiales bacterium SCGC AG-110-P3]